MGYNKLLFHEWYVILFLGSKETILIFLRHLY